MFVQDFIKLFKLQKLQISSYDNAERIDNDAEVFEAMFNPESFRQTFKNHFTEVQTDATNQQNRSFSYSLPSSVSMKLIFDNTLLQQRRVQEKFFKKNGYRSVSDRLNDFYKLLVRPKSEIHEPGYLKINWGKSLTNYQCKLDSLVVNHTVFDRGGNPLRAELDVTFVEDFYRDEQAANAVFSSPDLTHYRMVKEGDQLPLMCEKIYGSAKYYPQVARVNNLKDFRNLKQGQEIYFPPIAK